MRKARAFFWSRAAVGGLVISTASLAVVGVCAMFLDLPPDWAAFVRAVCVVSFACVAGFALGVAQVATAAAQTLQGKPEFLTAFKLALWCAVLTGCVSLAGVHLGWSLLTGHTDALPPWWAVDLGGLGLAFVKPAMSFVIEACVTVDRAEIKVAEDAVTARLDAIAAEERAARRVRAEPTPAPSPLKGEEAPAQRRSNLKVVEKVAGGAAAGLLLMGAAGAPAQAAVATEPMAHTQTAGAVTPAMRAEAKRMIAQGINPRRTSKLTRVPYSTCKRYAAEIRAAA